MNIRYINTMVQSIMIYGLESWDINRNNKAKIKYEMRKYIKEC